MRQEKHTDARGEASRGGTWDRLRSSLRRVFSYRGPEREATLIIAKSALAATIAWYVAAYMIGSQFPAFAPFAAVLMLQVTVYQSVLQSLRFVLAIVLGVSLQGLLALAFEPDMWTFAMVTLIALVIGRWRHLGDQGSQVVTATFFASAAFLTGSESTDRVGLLVSLVVLVLVGCAIGIVINIVVIPPMRYRSAEYAIENLAKAVRELIADISQAISEGPPTGADSGDWRYRAHRLQNLAERTRDTVDRAAESVRWNPRRVLIRTEPPFNGYHTVVDRLSGISAQLSSIAEMLNRTSDDPDVPTQQFLAHYAAFLGHTRDAAQLLAELDTKKLNEQTERMSEFIALASDEQTAMASATVEHEITLSNQARIYGGLLVDADRLIGEFQYIRTTLANALQRTGTDPDAEAA